MAIQKIPVHGADITSTILELLVPTYYDSYEESDTPGTYNLYKGSNAIATVNSYGNVKIHYSDNPNNEMWTIASQYVCDYLYVCSNGLAYSIHYGNENTAIRSFLTKDNNGDVVIACIDMTPSSTSNRTRAYAANHNSLSLSYSLEYAINQDLSLSTSLSPIVINDDNASYCPNAFVAMYRENRSVAAILDIAGTKYISNGFMYLRDE